MTLFDEVQLRRLNDKIASQMINPFTYTVTWSGKMERAPMTGKEMCEFSRDKLLMIGTDIGDPMKFWENSPTGELSHVFEIFRLACMIDEVAAECAMRL